MHLSRSGARIGPFIAAPGGYGTLEELFEQLPWGQRGMQSKPCGVVNVAHYFASDQNRAGVRSKVSVTLYRDWGTENETVQRKVLTLTRGKDKHEVLTIDLK